MESITMETRKERLASTAALILKPLNSNPTIINLNSNITINNNTTTTTTTTTTNGIMKIDTLGDATSNVNNVLIDSTNIERFHHHHTPKWTNRPPRGSGSNLFSGSTAGKRKVKNKTNKESKVRHLSSTCAGKHDNGVDPSISFNGCGFLPSNAKTMSKHRGCKKTYPRNEPDFMLDDSSAGSSPPSHCRKNKKSPVTDRSLHLHPQSSQNTEMHLVKRSLSWVQSLRRKKQSANTDPIVNYNLKKSSKPDVIEEKNSRASKTNKNTNTSANASCLMAISVTDDSNVEDNNVLMSDVEENPFTGEKISNDEKEHDEVKEQASRIADDYIQNSLAESKMVVDCARAVLKDCIRERTYSSSGWKKSDGSPERRRPSWRRFLHSSNDGEESAFMKSSSSGINTSTLVDEPLSVHEHDNVAPWRRRYLSSSTDEELCALMKAPSSSSWSDSNDAWRHQNSGIDCWTPSGFEMNDEETLTKEKGLPVEARYQLPLSLSTFKDADIACSICQNNFCIAEHITTLPCKHFFHAICADRWLWNHVSCPICRAEIDVNTVLNRPDTCQDNIIENISLKEKEDTRRRLRILSYGAEFSRICEDATDDTKKPESMLDKIICSVTLRHKS